MLLLIVLVALQIPSVQQFAAQKAAGYLAGTLNTRVTIGSFSTDWRNSVVLKDFYVEDLQQDTLWYSGRLGLDMKIFSLLRGELHIDNLQLEDATAKLHIRPDSSTNFDFVVDAFTNPADTTPMKLNLRVLNLENVYVNLRDEAAGNHVQTRVGHLLATIDKVDPEKELYLINEVNITNTWVNFTQTKLPPVTEPEPLTMQLDLNRLGLENIRFRYQNQVARQQVSFSVGKGLLTVDKLDLPGARINLDKLELENTSVAYSQEKYKPQEELALRPAESARKLDESVEKSTGRPTNWELTLNSVEISGLQAAIDNHNMPKQASGIDYDHLLFRNVNLDAEDLQYSQSSMGGKINQLQLQEQSGFVVKNLQAKVTVDSTRARLADLDLKTGNSHLRKEVALRYRSLDELIENPEHAAIDIDIDNSLISMRDVLYFAPDLAQNPSFRQLLGTSVKLNGRAEGTLDNLTVNQFMASGLTGTTVNATGTIRNLTDPDKLYLDLRIHRLSTTRTDVLALAPKGSLPPDIRIPASLSMSGMYRGTLANFDAKADVRSSFGNFTADVDMDPGRKGAEPFRARISTQGFDLGQLLVNNQGLGKVAFNGTITGQGLTPETMVAQLNANIASLEYNGYTYKDVKVKSDINRQLYTIDARSEDPNLAFAITGDVNLRNASQPAYNLNLDLQSINLQALNLFPDDLQIEGKLQTDLSGNSLQTLQGTLSGTNLRVRHLQKYYPIDSLQLSISQAGGTTDIQLNSDLAIASIQSQNDLATFATALQKHVSNYFDLQPDPPFPADLRLKDFNIELRLRKTELIASFIPGLQRLVPGRPLTASYVAATYDLKVDAHFPRIVYTGFDLKETTLEARGGRDKIDFNLNLKELSDSTILVPNLSLKGTARDNTITARVATADDKGKEQFVLGGLLSSLGPGYRFSIDPDQLVINADKWSVPKDNFLQFDTNLLYASNIRLERNGSFVAFNSVGPVRPDAPLQVQFGNFDLGYAMSTVQRHENHIGGVVNGQATLTDFLSDHPAFTSDLTINQFAYMGNPVGDITIKANTAGNHRYNLTATLTGNGNQANVSGFYEAQPNASILNLDANISSLNLATLQGFSEGILKDMGGTVNGQLRITGTLNEPAIRGHINFRAAQFNIAMLNSTFRLQDGRVNFTDEGIVLPNLTLTDAENNNLLLTGTIFTRNYTDFRFDLTARTDRFLAMNSTPRDNTLYYGKVLLAANATVKGDQNLPVVNGRVNVLDGSDLTMVIPGEAAGAAEREGIVEFFDGNDSLRSVIDGARTKGSNIGFQGVEVNVNITVTDATLITVILDPVTGDHLEARGNTNNLAAGINANGDIKLSGRYVLTEGEYKMIFYNLVSRELKLSKGDFIEWYGNPLDAHMNINAVYRIRASAMELFAAEVGRREQAQVSQFRTPLPFEVLVNLEGEMLKPDFDFDIRLEEKERAAFSGQVEAKLQELRQDQANLDKQVFALLVLGRFLAEDPMASSGGGLSSTARNSLSQVLSDQLNDLTQKYAGGLGLEVGVVSYDDYSTNSAQGRTDLNVALRQQFFNDRVTVRVGGDVGLEGPGREQNNMSNFGGDLSVEYSITSDGRLRVRGFRRNQYLSYFEGDVQETGLALIFVRDYNNFSDLFRNLEKRLARKDERIQEERAKTSQKVKEDEAKDREETQKDKP